MARGCVNGIASSDLCCHSRTLWCLKCSTNHNECGISEYRHGKSVSTQVYQMEMENCVKKDSEAKSKVSVMEL